MKPDTAFFDLIPQLSLKQAHLHRKTQSPTTQPKTKSIEKLSLLFSKIRLVNEASVAATPYQGYPEHDDDYYGANARHIPGEDLESQKEAGKTGQLMTSMCSSHRIRRYPGVILLPDDHARCYRRYQEVCAPRKSGVESASEITVGRVYIATIGFARELMCSKQNVRNVTQTNMRILRAG